LKPWQRNFVIGMFAGALFIPAYQYYEESRLRDSFVKYKLVSKEPVSSTASIFKLQPQASSDDFNVYKEAWRKGIWNVHFKQPQIQIIRAYTPLPPVDGVPEKESKNLRFLIRRDPHGEVSSYLHNLPVGAEIELRGPNLEYYLTPDIRQVVFFAGGTGIAPALQIAHTMFDAESPEDKELKKARKLHILWASRKREDCAGGISDAPVAEPMPPKKTITGLFTKSLPKPVVDLSSQEKGAIVQELEALKTKYPGRITVEYFVNDEDRWIDEVAVFKALSRFDDKDFSAGTTTPQEQRQVIISGPAGFITYLAGPKEWKSGREEQGGMGKILAHAIGANPHNVKVWKI
jgi:ferredoxin-NADP reductase